jgi:hypothetical protein
MNDPRRCWAPKGVRPIVPKQIIREYSYAYGAVGPFTGNACFLILPAMNVQCMNVFLQELSRRYPKSFLLLIHDRAPCHSKTALSIPENIMIENIPPYSPELNPTENIWKDVREKFFHNLVFDSQEALEDQLKSACNFYEQNPNIVKSITGWKWIIKYS